MSAEMLAQLKPASVSRTTRSTRSTACSTSPTSMRSPHSTAPSSRTSRGGRSRSHASPSTTVRATSSARFDAVTCSSTCPTSPSGRAWRHSSALPPATRTSSASRPRCTGRVTTRRSCPALIEAAESGKQSVCLVELQARFDERRNIEWSRALERAGVHVVYGFPNLKIHAKATLIVRREANGLKRYVHVGTGNYHALTARTYEDAGLFSADEELAADVADLFNYLTGRTATALPQGARSPFHSPRTADRGDPPGRAVGSGGKRAKIRIKVNALTDEAIIELYELHRRERRSTSSLARSARSGPEFPDSARTSGFAASWAVSRAQPCFRPRGRGKSTYLMGSADLMPRNLDNRLEIVVPVEDGRARQKISAMFDALLADNAQAWELRADSTWKRLRPKKDDRPLGAQAALMRSAVARARRRIAARRG